MKVIGVTQRVDLIKDRGERRDALDQRWVRFLMACGVLPVVIPNNAEAVRRLLKKIRFDGFLLTGGNDLRDYGGDAAERDEVEHRLLDTAIRKAIPVVGVCRGMQLIQNHFDLPLVRVKGHVKRRQAIMIDHKKCVVNSFHRWGTKGRQIPFDVWAIAADGVIKAIHHPRIPIFGIMWHPERIRPFRKSDIHFFKAFFNA